MRSVARAVTCLAFCGMLVPAARAQDVLETAPPYIAFVDGEATLEREDLTEPAVHDSPIVAGDRVRTTTGRVEILYPDGSALDLDEFTSIEFQAPTLLRVTSGRVVLTVAGASDPANALQFQLNTPIASAQTEGPGEYRVAILSNPSGIETELAVVRGAATLLTELGSMPLRAGERSIAWDDRPPSSPQYFNSARFDAFDRWALARRDERLGSRSAQYLPSDLRMYGGTFDRYGQWEYDAPYGYVWYPSVTPGWRPYYDGYWASVPTYGWTWIGVDLWSWPTHHYGRWGYRDARWFWIPERHWAPAWVSWGGAPGYVSWCPLGFDNRPLFALSTFNSWSGWTVVSRSHFGGRGWNTRQYAVSPRTLPVNTPFITHATAPVAPPHAVPRQAGAGAPLPPSAQNRRLSTFGRQSVQDGQPPAAERRFGVGGRQAPVPAQPPAASQTPRAVGRPQLSVPQRGDVPANSQPSPPSDAWGVFRSPLPNAGRTRPSNSDNTLYPARPNVGRPRGVAPAVPPAAASPAAPPSPFRPYSGVAIPRSGAAPRGGESVMPAPGGVTPPMMRGSGASPRFERPGIVGHGPIMATPSVSPMPQPARPAGPPAAGDGGRARSRGAEASQSGSGQSQGQAQQGQAQQSQGQQSQGQQSQGQQQSQGGHGSRGPR